MAKERKEDQVPTEELPVFYIPIVVHTVVHVQAKDKGDAVNQVAKALKKPIKYMGWALPGLTEEIDTSEHGQIVGQIEGACVSEEEWMKFSNRKQDRWW